jgi:ubiquinone/menaquinone biosynthesis C-methylase UbiE
MRKRRVPETDQGITGDLETRAYDQMMRRLRDRGWLETNQIVKSGISSGLALEVGPGPGYLGLEWLKKTEGTSLKGIDISEDMVVIAKRNSVEYGLQERAEYIAGDARAMPFEDAYFDGVFTNGSLHEWSHPEEIINEISRVLKPGGLYFISDLRRNMNRLMKWFMWLMTKPKEIRPGLLSSIDAAYTVSEIESMLPGTRLKGWTVTSKIVGLTVSGRKPSNE